MKTVKYIIAAAMLLLNVAAYAQYGNFDYTDPAEPGIKYNVSVSSSPANINARMQGAGTYSRNQTVEISQVCPDGYEFLYWSLNGRKHSESGSFTYTVSQESEFVAHYQRVFTVRFVGADGQTISEQKVAKGQSAIAPDAPEVDDQTFIGWYTDEYKNVQSDLTVRGIYVKIPEPVDGKFVVVFVDYDGTELSVQTIEPGHSAVPPQKPGRSGYLFYRWRGGYVNVRANSVVVATYVEIKTDDSQKKYVVFPCE